MTSELQTYTLARTGSPPLVFEGEFLAGVSGEEYIQDERRRNPRWHDLELYRSKGGVYVLHVRYRAEFKDEVGFDEVLTFRLPADLAGVLKPFDPTAHVIGYPEGVANWEKKQKRMKEEIRARFGRCVSDLFALLGPEFAERFS